MSAIKPEVIEFWKELVYSKDGKLDETAVMNELSDYYHMIHETSLVFDAVTSGMISKPNTKAFEVIGIFEENNYSKGITQDDVTDMIKDCKTHEDLVEALKDYFQLPNSETNSDKRSK